MILIYVLFYVDQLLAQRISSAMLNVTEPQPISLVTRVFIFDLMSIWLLGKESI